MGVGNRNSIKMVSPTTTPGILETTKHPGVETVYCAHPMSTYGTPEEAQDIALLESMGLSGS